MLILFDNNVPRGLSHALPTHQVTEARQRGWAELKNGALLRAAEEAGFECLITVDKNLRHQQNMAGRKISLVVLTQQRFQLLRNHLQEIEAAVQRAEPGTFTLVEIPYA